MPRSWLRPELGLDRLVHAHATEAGALEQLVDLVRRIEPLGVELVGQHALLGVDHDFAGQQALAVFGERPLAADELVLVDPLPGALLEMAAHPVAVGQVHDQLAVRAQRPLDRLEHGQIVLLALEIAEGVAEERDAIERAFGDAEAAGVALVEARDQPLLLGALARQPDQIARAVDAGDPAEAAPRQLQAVPALAAAQVQYAIAGLEPGAFDGEIDLALGVRFVLDDVAVGLEVERVEQALPPVGRQMPLEVRDRAEGARPHGRRFRRPLRARHFRRLCRRCAWRTWCPRHETPLDAAHSGAASGHPPPPSRFPDKRGKGLPRPRSGCLRGVSVLRCR